MSDATGQILSNEGKRNAQKGSCGGHHETEIDCKVGSFW